MGEEDSPKRCPVCQRVPLILFGLAGGTFEHARVGCLCRSVVLEHLNTEESWTVAAAK
jgi:hypothetical protein